MLKLAIVKKQCLGCILTIPQSRIPALNVWCYPVGPHLFWALFFSGTRSPAAPLSFCCCCCCLFLSALLRCFLLPSTNNVRRCKRRRSPHVICLIGFRLSDPEIHRYCSESFVRFADWVFLTPRQLTYKNSDHRIKNMKPLSSKIQMPFTGNINKYNILGIIVA